MNYFINPLKSEDGKRVIDILNYYVENSFAAFPEITLPPQAFEMLMQMSNGLPSCSISDANGYIIGFGLLRHHNNLPVFLKTAEITYFLDPNCTGKGLGKMMLEWLEDKGKNMKIENILAPISSLNPGSINFHKKNGFLECGRFSEIGFKKGKAFDVVWMQKKIKM